MRFIGHSRGALTVPHFGRVHSELGFAFRMIQSTAAISLGQLEIIEEIVQHRDQMIRLLYGYLDEIDGITPLTIPEYLDTYSCWMAGFSIDPEQFVCTPEEFAQQVATAGIPGAGQGKYYLMPAALTFLQKRAANQSYPYSMPPASRAYSYSGASCPNGEAFLENFIRWSSFSEKYQPEHCELAAKIVSEVADRNRC